MNNLKLKIMRCFITTKIKITNKIKEVLDKLKVNFIGLEDVWFEASNNSNCNVREIAEHIYHFNQHVISKVKYTKGLILEGFVNNDIDYQESDLNVVDIMLSVSLYRVKSSPEFSKPLCFSSEEMNLKLTHQINTFQRLLNELPEEMINNYKENSKFISGIKLDLYQLIYLSLIHCSYHLSKIKTLKETEEIV